MKDNSVFLGDVILPGMPIRDSVISVLVVELTLAPTCQHDKVGPLLRRTTSAKAVGSTRAPEVRRLAGYQYIQCTRGSKSFQRYTTSSK